MTPKAMPFPKKHDYFLMRPRHSPGAFCLLSKFLFTKSLDYITFRMSLPKTIRSACVLLLDISANTLA